MDKRIGQHVIITLLLCVCIYTKFVGSTNHEFLLRQYLFNVSRYSPEVVPRVNINDNIFIYIKWSLIRLKGLFEKDTRLTQSVALELTWTDDYLLWDPQSYGGLTSFTTNGKDVWTPDIRIFNRLESGLLENGVSVEKIKVMSNGTLLATPFGELSTICPVDPNKFPVDCHSCKILLGGSTVSERQIFLWGTPSFTFFNFDKHAYWDIQDVETLSFGPITTLELVLKRVPLYYIYNIVFPASALSFLCILAFFIPIEEGERVGFGMTIFLTFMVLMLQVGSLIPETSRSSPVIGKYFLFLIGGSLVTIVNSVVVSYFTNNTEPKNDNKVFPVELNTEEKEEILGKEKHCRQIITSLRRMIKSHKRKLRHYLTPLKTFDLLSLTACFIICLYAHIDLISVISEDTCNAVS